MGRWITCEDSWFSTTHDALFLRIPYHQNSSHLSLRQVWQWCKDGVGLPLAVPPMLVADSKEQIPSTCHSNLCSSMQTWDICVSSYSMSEAKIIPGTECLFDSYMIGKEDYSNITSDSTWKKTYEGKKIAIGLVSWNHSLNCVQTNLVETSVSVWSAVDIFSSNNVTGFTVCLPKVSLFNHALTRG